jgi:pre-rRNA-processing protein TSR1
MKTQETHRSGPLKQDNKRHKLGRHRSNRSISSSNKGRKEDVKTITKQKDSIKRHERRNQLKQLRSNKRHQTLNDKRSLGRESVPPILVSVLDLNHNQNNENMNQLIELIRNCDQNSVFNNENERNFHISFAKLKTRFEFIFIDNNDLFSALDSVKIADILLILHSFSSVDNSLLDAIYSHCLPTTVHIINGLNGLSLKKKNDLKKSVQKLIDSKFPEEKLRSIDSSSEALQLMHFMSNCKRKHNSFRSHRTQLLAESFEFVANELDSELGSLKVWGYVRNRSLDVNALVHIPGFGDYQMSVIEANSDPNPLTSKSLNRNSSNAMNTEDMNESRVIQRADPSIQQSLDSENIPDPMEGEQTWPTSEELNTANEEKIVKKVPKGTSEYQAVWIVDDSNDEKNSDEEYESDSQDSDENNSLSKMEAQEESDEENDDHSDDEEEEEDMETISLSGTVNEANYDQKMDLNEEQSMLQKFKEQRQDQMFPDEVDTPIDKLAKVRFARYRGLKSFRTSSWDPKENLPLDYARIYQFENFARTKKRVFNMEQTGAQLGWFVCVHVINVPKFVYQSFVGNKKPLILYGLLPHEQRMSTMNLVIKRINSFTEPIKSKERLIFHVGCRRFSACPIFSSHTNGDKHKMERFLRSDVSVVATLYAPITFPPASVLVYKEYEDKSQHLVATGSLLSCDPNRIIVKRIVLSGHPFKINRKHAVVRYMFFNREDILWFKPIELRTKYGRKGHIREPLGTHGHMKCIFDKQLKSQDTVLMNLYKRIYPKWTFDSHINAPIIANNSKNNEECDEENMQ